MPRPDIQAITAREKLATKRHNCTWYVHDDRDEGDLYVIAFDDEPRYFGGHLTEGKMVGTGVEGGFAKECDAEFVAHARKDIPDLLAYIMELESKLNIQNA